MNKPITHFGEGIMRIIKVNFKKTRAKFHATVDKYNAQFAERVEGNRFGYDKRKINNKHEVCKVIDYLCDNFQKISNGVLKVTRTHIARGISSMGCSQRSTTTVDRFLSCLSAIGYVKLRDKGLWDFGTGKAINCLYLGLDAEKIFECDVIEKATKPKYQKNKKSPEFPDFEDTLQELIEYPYLV